MKLSVFITAFFLCCLSAEAQKNIDDLLSRFNDGSVPYISVEALKMKPKDYLILDTREREEFEVSHLPNAVWAGTKPNKNQLDSLAANADKPIVVYCSVGIRSEDFGQQLQALGYKNVQNLYGSIFAWKDAGYPVVDSTNTETERVHVFGKKWGRYLKSGEKVYNP